MSALTQSLAPARPWAGRRPSRRTVYAAALNHGVFALFPLMFTGFVLYAAIHIHAFAVDFHNCEWLAGQRLLHGLSPYPGAHSAAVLSEGRPGAMPFAYPAVGAVMYAGIALIPHYVADAVVTVAAMAAVFVSLRLAGARDWRLYGLVFLWPAVMIGWQTANLTLPLVAGAAAVWHFRDRPRRIGALLALMISLKIVLWPLALWLLATRRFRSVAYLVAWGLALNVFAWAVVGYNELPHYLTLLQAFNHAGEQHAYSVINLALHVGASPGIATAVGYALAGLAAAWCVKFGRQGRDRAAFALAIGVVLLATPIVWLHYFALLLVPLALIKPRLGAVWLLPLLMFGCPPTSPAMFQIVLVLVITTVMFVVMLREDRRHLSSTTRRPRAWQSARLRRVGMSEEALETT